MGTLRVAFALLLSAASVGLAADDFLSSLKDGQPPAVVELIDRIVACNHWKGEDPYDAERSEEIRRAVTRFRCDSLEADEAALLRQLNGDEKARKVIDAAKGLYY